MFFSYYNYFKTILKMNFVSFSPYLYINAQVVPQSAQKEAQLSTQAILTSLASSLRKSLNKFEKEFELPSHEGMEDKQPVKKASLARKVSKLTEAPKEEVVPKADNLKNIQKENVQVKKAIEVQKTQKATKESSQHNKNDQAVQEYKEGCKGKPLERQHRIKKDKHRHKKGHSHFRAVDISLIETATLLPLGITKSTLLQRKKSLLQRHVLLWNEKLKNRRDKCEIRMLNC